MQFETSLRNLMLDQIKVKVGSNALLRLYSGVKPPTCETALSFNTLLVELECDTDFANPATNAILTVNISNSTNAIATGVITFFRIYESTGNACYIQGDVSTQFSDMLLNKTDVSENEPFEISDFILGIGDTY